MTREQVNALRAAGIQDKMIIDLIISETAEAVAPDPEPEKNQPEPEKKQPEPERKRDPEPEKNQEPEPEKIPEPQTDKILAAIEKLTGAVLAHNVAGTGRDDEPEKSADDIMGELLRGRK